MSLRSRRASSHNQQTRTAAALATVALSVEQLEALLLLSGTGIPDASFDSPYGSVTNTVPHGYTPAQIMQAYGFNQISFSTSKGAVRGDGAGQTIAIVDAYHDANIAADLAAFDQQFGIAAPPKFTVITPAGTPSNSDWALETALDVEWAHAMAPKANILLVEAKSASLTDLLAAVNTARNTAGVSVVSMSWGAGEFLGETFYDSYFTTPTGHNGVTFVASSGDSGAGTSWPAVSPNVLAVGGTTLTISSNGSYVSETAWSGSGGGTSSYETRPTYQNGIQTSRFRTVPDVSFDANPNTGFAVYDSVKTGGQSGWFQVGGTSAGAPQWAALVAIADQGRVLAGQGTLANGQASIYSLSTADFHDIRSGSNGFSATVGYDLVTGRGSPFANLVAQDLVRVTSSTSATTHTVVQTVTTKAHGHASTDGIGTADDGTVATQISDSFDSVSSSFSTAFTQLSTTGTLGSSGSSTFRSTSPGNLSDGLSFTSSCELGTEFGSDFAHTTSVTGGAVGAETASGNFSSQSPFFMRNGANSDLSYGNLRGAAALAPATDTLIRQTAALYSERGWIAELSNPLRSLSAGDGQSTAALSAMTILSALAAHWCVQSKETAASRDRRLAVLPS